MSKKKTCIYCGAEKYASWNDGSISFKCGTLVLSFEGKIKANRTTNCLSTEVITLRHKCDNLVHALELLLADNATKKCGRYRKALARSAIKNTYRI